MRLESEPAATLRTTNSTGNMSSRRMRMAVSDTVPRKWVLHALLLQQGE